MQKFTRDDFEKFHDYNCLIKKRLVFFGSEFYCDDGCGESGVDFASATKVIKNLLYLDSQKKDVIQLHYSSPGGDWDRGIAIHDCIKGLRSKVIMIGYGCVRSMGTIIMQACDKRYLTPKCRFMIHDGEFGYVGTSKDAEKNFKENEWTSRRMHEIYYERMKSKNNKITIKDIAKMCEHDYFMSGEQAVEFGLADKVL